MADHAEVTRAGAGDPDAFWSLMEPHDRRLRALAYRLLGDRDMMDDALQDAYLKAFRALLSFRGTASFGSWLYRIVFNSCMDLLRRSRPWQYAELEAMGTRPTPDRAPRRWPPADSTLQRPASLPIVMRAAVLLVDAEGMDYGEAAEILGVSRGTVTSRLNRARAHLREALENDKTEGVEER